MCTGSYMLRDVQRMTGQGQTEGCGGGWVLLSGGEPAFAMYVAEVFGKGMPANTVQDKALSALS